MVDLDAPEDAEGQIREALAVGEADRGTSITVAGMAVPLVVGGTAGPIGAAIVAGLKTFLDGRKQARFQTRVVATFQGIERRLSQVGDRLDKDFVTTDEFFEMVEEGLERAARERDEDKRELYAAILANTARRGVDRRFYPTALKLLDALEPIHVDILRELLRRREKKGEAAAERNTSTGELALKFHLDDLEELRLGGLAQESEKHFGGKLKGVADWQEAIGQARRGEITPPGIEDLMRTVQEWDDQVLEHVWYLGKEGLVHQVSNRNTSINELGVRLLGWLSEPED